MANYLVACEEWIKRAWKEVKPKIALNNDADIKLKEFLRETELSSRHTDAEDFQAFESILTNKFSRYRTPFSPWLSCKQLYKSMVILLNSNYKEYDIITIGNAKRYFDEATPLYCKLSGEQAPYIRTATKSNLQEMLKTGDILKQLAKDIPGIIMLTNMENYMKMLNASSNVGVIAIAHKDSYVLQRVNAENCSKGIHIDGTVWYIRLYNIRTNKEVKINGYSDIKRIMNRSNKA